jgi:two-component system copper resistance phosphate regulon response regulator CusR
MFRRQHPTSSSTEGDEHIADPMRLLIIEGNVRTADYLKKGFGEQGCAVDVAHDGIDGMHLALEHDYDALVLDAMLPGLDGFALVKALRDSKQTPVIMLTACDTIEDRVRGLRMGADDYLVKPFSFQELLARVHALHRRHGAQRGLHISIADLEVDLLARKAWRAGTRLDLTAKEYALLAALVRRQGEILSKTTIAELVWDMNFDSSTNVVEVAVKRLRTKIDDAFSPKLLHTIRGMGYVMEDRQPRPSMT